MGNHVSSGTANVETADLVAADLAAQAVKDAGGGDIAVYNARRAELETIRDRAIRLVAIDRDSAIAKGEVWGSQSKRGSQMIANANRDYQTAVDEANAS